MPGERVGFACLSWEEAKESDLSSFGADAEILDPRTPASPELTVAVVMMAKDEADIIGQNIAWHIYTGIRRFVIIDNASVDRTSHIIDKIRQKYLDCEIFTIYDPILRYMQSEKTTGLFRFAMSVWPDVQWICPLDADELMIPQRGLSVLKDVPKEIDVLVIPKAVHFRAVHAEAPDVLRLEEFPVRSDFSLVPPKVIARTRSDIWIAQGNHFAGSIVGRTLAHEGGLRHGICIREFPNRSFNDMLKKILNGSRAIQAAENFLGRSVGGDHWKRYREILDAEGENGFRNIYKNFVKSDQSGLIMDSFILPENCKFDLEQNEKLQRHPVLFPSARPDSVQFTLCNVPPAEWGFWLISEGDGFQLHPGSPGAEPSSIQFPCLFDGQSRFRVQIEVDGRSAAAVLFSVAILPAGGASVNLRRVVAPGGSLDWLDIFDPVSGPATVVVATQLAPGAGSNGFAWSFWRGGQFY